VRHGLRKHQPGIANRRTVVDEVSRHLREGEVVISGAAAVE
jgi:hypothetical protein